MDWQRYIKILSWPETMREQIVFNDDTKIRLDPQDGAIKLKADHLGLFPVATNIWAKVPMTNPKAHKQWLAIQPLSDEPTGTYIYYKLYDGVQEYFHNGTQWVVAGANDWNTVFEINDHIDTFKSAVGAEHALGFIINLRTNDTQITPSISGIKILLYMYLDTQESWLIKTLMPALQSITAPADFIMETAAITTTIDLNNYDMAKLNITDVRGVFNVSDDPEEFTDILSSYNPGTKVITLATSVPAGKQLKVIVEYNPIGAIATQQDYTELASLPAVTLEDILVVERSQSFEGDTFVAPGASSGYKMSGPDNLTFRANIVVLTNLLVDQQRLANAIYAGVKAIPQLRWLDTDEMLDLVIVSPYVAGYRPNLDDIYSGSFEIEIRNVPYYLAPPTEHKIVKDFVLTLESTN